MMDNVDKYMDALGRQRKDNGRDLAWCYSLAHTDEGEGIRITMQNRWAKPPVTYQRFIPSNYIYAMDDPESAAAKMIENMYEEAGEHIVDKKLLISPEEALKRLKELSEDLSHGWVDVYGPEDRDDDELVIEALDVAIACLEEKCHE